jgi:hypothetical protein
MEQYPKIDGSSKAPIGQPCIAFYKYDGSNLRWEWSPKRGWHKFGTRHRLFDESEPVYNQAIPIFMDTMADEIVKRIKNEYRNIQRITAFTEFFGQNSFVGKHDDEEQKELKLFDIYLFKQGMIKPRDFVKMFGELPYAAQVIYEGNLNKQFIDDVRNGLYPVYEGVVAKGIDFSVKIKTNAYFKKLNEVYGTEYRHYWE